MLAIVAFVAISFTACNGSPAPSASIPEEMHGTWGDRSGATTLEISADSFVSKTATDEINFTDSQLYTMTVEGTSVTFENDYSSTTFTYADGVITETTSLGDLPVEYTPVDSQ